jgi:hypothetical protein
MKKSLHLLLAALLLTVGACNDDPLFEIPPDAPTTVAASVQGTSANITWTPGAGATSQEVRMSPLVPVPLSQGSAMLVEDDRVQTFDDNTTSSALFENLTEGTSYSATVTAINGSSRTSSDPIVVQIAGSVLAPVLTTCGPADGGADPSSVFMEWTAVDNAENYAVTLTPASGGDPLADVAPAAETSWIWDSTIYEITEGETYTCQVASVIGGDTYPSNTLEYTVAGNAAPTVTIVTPADMSEFTQGDTDITFEGNAVDQFDNEIPPEDLEWTSDVDGVLGTGNVLDVAPADLTAGNHVITLTAIDSESNEGTASINIVINEASGVVSFANDVQPYFVDNGCTACHGSSLQLGDIRLDSYTEVSTGGNANGPLIVAGDSNDATAILIPKLLADHNNGPDDATYANDVLAPWIDDGAQDN